MVNMNAIDFDAAAIIHRIRPPSAMMLSFPCLGLKLTLSSVCFHARIEAAASGHFLAFESPVAS